MEQIIEVEKYSPSRGVHPGWRDEGTYASVSLSDGAVIIRANQEGMVNLARCLLTLAQQQVPSGSHIHLDNFAALEDDSLELILERINE